MKKINLGDKIKLKLREAGIMRTEEIIDGILHDSNLTDAYKVYTIRYLRSRIDGNGYLIAPIDEVINDYSQVCFDSMVGIVQVSETNDLYKLDLRNEASIRLNEFGMKKITQIIQKIQNDKTLTDMEKESLINNLKSMVDEEEGYLTTSINKMMNICSINCFDSKSLIVHDEMSYNMSNGIWKKK